VRAATHIAPLQGWGESSGHFRLFVNRRAYTVQSARPHPESGRHYYYRPTDRKTGSGLSLPAESLRHHLAGEITIPRSGINPATQGCKWIAIAPSVYCQRTSKA
jgi:hypothetical protein